MVVGCFFRVLEDGGGMYRLCEMGWIRSRLDGDADGRGALCAFLSVLLELHLAIHENQAIAQNI